MLKQTSQLTDYALLQGRVRFSGGEGTELAARVCTRLENAEKHSDLYTVYGPGWWTQKFNTGGPWKSKLLSSDPSYR